jgi:hypothetical protein
MISSIRWKCRQFIISSLIRGPIFNLSNVDPVRKIGLSPVSGKACRVYFTNNNRGLCKDDLRSLRVTLTPLSFSPHMQEVQGIFPKTHGACFNTFNRITFAADRRFQLTQGGRVFRSGGVNVRTVSPYACPNKSPKLTLI